jgi:subtilisin family serine protease
MRPELLSVLVILFIVIFLFSNDVYGSETGSEIEITIIEPPTQPTPEPPTQPTPEPPTQPTTEPPTQPTTEPPTQPTTEPPTQPTTEPPTPPRPPIQISDTEKINIDVGGEKIPFQYIVVLEDLASVNASTLGDTFQALNAIVEGLGAEIIYTYNGTIAGFAFKGPNQLVVDQIAGVLELDPRVKFVEQDQTVVPFETISTGIDRIDADPLFTNSRVGNLSADVDIAIIDSGIDLDHPDLNIYNKTTSIIPQDPSLPSSSSNSDSLINNEIDLEKIDLDLKENTTATFYPPFSKDTVSTADDKCGHGTHVAGVAAAKHNSFGVVGIAPGARLWAIKVLEFNDSTGKCEGAISSVIQAIDYITKNAKEIDIANLSLGCKCNSSALKEAIDKSVAQNVIYVVAAGNIHADASSFSPANHDDVISVSAIADDDGKCGSAGIPLWIDAGNMSGYTTDDSFASFSNYGPTIDVAAPGVSINSTYLNGSYAEMGGTSIAAPHVTGAAALYKMSNQNASVNDARTILADSGSNDKTVCDGSGRGYFTEDADSNPEPLLYLFDAIKLLVDRISYGNATVTDN